MRIQQLSELLNYVATCRLEMAQLYSRLHSQADSSRVKLMLEYFQQHERQTADKLENYIDAAPKKILDTWYKDIVFEDFSALCLKQTLPANMSEEDILELHLELDNKLIGLIEKTSLSSASAETKGALEDLVRVEKIQQQRLVHSSIRMDDI
ncbi:hypothetical protein CXF83_19795 [Shewanella sp. Choline-02u-19]|jgi:hypothetical protein|uniref:hypothetical protein n=1 Tax=unclassified Shewanella TaxID=196818 RepID=UPI000C320682|nr:MULTISPECIES: hypothetical protein [unclassified Shewanella]PKG76510.1 hypothetical protein CXF86_00005 [Shewanella sp. GutCb]PKH55442.1 hypothetical protein CXF84_18050 [Shewanella sp. Bg11-22]PKI28789.1 hypothetical protein CXF83_19795 [Shewanella sp. Choline-02u-19]